MAGLPEPKDDSLFLNPSERAKRIAKWTAFCKNVEEAFLQPSSLRLSSMKVSYRESSFEDDDSESEVEKEKTKIQKRKKTMVSHLKYKENLPKINKSQRRVVSGNVNNPKRIKNNYSEEQEDNALESKRGRKTKTSKNKESITKKPLDEHDQTNKSNTINNEDQQNLQETEKQNKVVPKKRGRPKVTNKTHTQLDYKFTATEDKHSVQESDKNNKDVLNEVEKHEKPKKTNKIKTQINEALRDPELIVIVEKLSKNNEEPLNKISKNNELAVQELSEEKKIDKKYLNKDENELSDISEVQVIPKKCKIPKKINKINSQINQTLIDSEHIANLSESNKKTLNQEYKDNEPDVTKLSTKEKNTININNFQNTSTNVNATHNTAGRQANINLISNVCLNNTNTQASNIESSSTYSRSFECFGFSPTNLENPETGETDLSCQTKNTPLKTKVSKEMKEALCQTDDLENSAPKFKDSFSQTEEKMPLSKSEMLDNLVELVIKRNESKVLQDGQKVEWSARFLKSCITYCLDEREIKAYIKKKMAMDHIESIKQEIEVDLKSYLGNLLLLRKDGRDDLNDLINAEWKRLLKFLPLKSVVLYSRYILNRPK